MTDAINDCKCSDAEVIKDLEQQNDELVDQIIALMEDRKFLWGRLQDIKSEIDKLTSSDLSSRQRRECIMKIEANYEIIKDYVKTRSSQTQEKVWNSREISMEELMEKEMIRRRNYGY